MYKYIQCLHNTSNTCCFPFSHLKKGGAWHSHLREIVIVSLSLRLRRYIKQPRPIISDRSDRCTLVIFKGHLLCNKSSKHSQVTRIDLHHENWALSMSLSLHGAEPLGTWAQWRKTSVNRIPPTCVVSYLRGSKNYTPIQLPLSSPPSSPGQTAMRMSPFTQGLNFRPAGNLLYRLLCSNEMFVSWQESPVELHYLKWQSVCYFYDCTIFARKQRYKHNCSLYASSQPSSMKARNCCRYVTFPTHRL